MLLPVDVSRRAATRYNRAWRDWAQKVFLLALNIGLDVDIEVPELAIGLKPPKESELASSAGVKRARDWVTAWRRCSLPGSVEWQLRRWSRAGDQQVAVQVAISGADDIATWAGYKDSWHLAKQRVWEAADVVRPHLRGRAEAAFSAGDAVHASASAWVELSDADWHRALDALAWLLEHRIGSIYARQLPIRGIDTKWMEHHSGAILPIRKAITGIDMVFLKQTHQYRCKACDADAALAGCHEFSLDVAGFTEMAVLPRHVVICENLVNTLCLDGLDGTLAIHGNGRAVTDLARVPWLADMNIVYWGDLDTHGFSILNSLRAHIPHVQSVLMDTDTLTRHCDLCVNEPSPASERLPYLNSDEQHVLAMLRKGDKTEASPGCVGR